MISTVARAGPEFLKAATKGGPAAAAGELYLRFAPRLARFLGGHRDTEKLVAGVSFPGHDAYGNPIEDSDPYQFADTVDPPGGASVPLSPGIQRILDALKNPMQTPGINPNARTPSAGGTSGPAVAPPGGRVGSVLRTGAALAGDLGDIVQTGGNIASYVPRPNESRQQAAGLQQNIQDTAIEIQRLVNSGQMDPDAALQALDSLAVRAVQMGQAGNNPDMIRASHIAGLVIANVRAGVETRRTAGIHASTAGGLQGSVRNQQDQFSTLLRERLLGKRADETAGSPVDQLFQPKRTVAEMLPGITDQANKMLPDLIGPEFGAQVRDRLRDYLAQPSGRY